MYEIRDDVPPPPDGPAKLSWPFHRMNVGQSLKIEFDQHWLQGCRAARSCGARRNWKFSTKWFKNAKDAQGKHAPYGMIWRVV